MQPELACSLIKYLLALIERREAGTSADGGTVPRGHPLGTGNRHLVVAPRGEWTTLAWKLEDWLVGGVVSKRAGYIEGCCQHVVNVAGGSDVCLFVCWLFGWLVGWLVG